MKEKRKSKILAWLLMVCVAAIMICYFVMSWGSDENVTFCVESAVSIAGGIIFAVGLRTALVGERKNIGIAMCCAGVLLPILLTACLLIRYKNMPYMLQAVMYAKKMFALFCPFLAIELLKRSVHFANRRRISFDWVVIFYYLVSFSAIALMQHAKVWQYAIYYAYKITWDTVETFYCAAVVNAVIFLYMASIPGSSKKYCKHCVIIAAIINLTALADLGCSSDHFCKIFGLFIEHFKDGGLIYALQKSEWLQYRAELLSNVIDGSYQVGVPAEVNTTLQRIVVHWSEEPLVCMRMAHGWAAVLGALILYAVLIGVLFFMKYENKDAERAGMVIKCSFAGMCGLSFISQMLLPADQLMTPLMGQGSVAVFMIIVYLALPRIFTDDIYLRREPKPFGKAKTPAEDERHLREVVENSNDEKKAA